VHYIDLSSKFRLFTLRNNFTLCYIIIYIRLQFDQVRQNGLFQAYCFIYYLESIIRQLQRITNKVLEKFLVGLLYSVSSVVSICRKHGRQLEERLLVMLAVVLGYVCT